MRNVTARATAFATTVALGLFVLGTAPGCGEDAPTSGPSGSEVELPDDGKADGAPKPSGTYTNQHPAPGQLSRLVLSSDRTYERDTFVVCVAAPCDPITETGYYRFTRGNNTYIKFYDDAGQALDRYVYKLNGAVLQVRLDTDTTFYSLTADTGAREGELCGGLAGLRCADGLECYSDPNLGCFDCPGTCRPAANSCPLTGVACDPSCPASGRLPSGAPCKAGNYDASTCECTPVDPPTPSCPLTGVVCDASCPASGRLPGGAPCYQGTWDASTCECKPTAQPCGGQSCGAGRSCQYCWGGSACVPDGALC
jgi:hypothetical protein